ncbi:hypothetical protein [Flavobacterium sp.]|uniref:hypothetical protein n=1 Tax=Flavobacterium sp. TaxID=239 RepID=UPI002FD90C81
MNIWILKYGKSNFSNDCINIVNDVTQTIDQLQEHDVFQRKTENFHLISIVTKFEKCQKKYIEISEDKIRGFSGLVIGKNEVDVDYRNISNINCDTPERYNGQFCLFSLNKDSFVCKADNMGFHKVFYFKDGNDIYVSNYLRLLRGMVVLKPDFEQIVCDFLTSRFGVFPGYNTLYEGVKTLPEYGQLILKEGDLHVTSYKHIDELLLPKFNFEENINRTIFEFKNAARYLRNFHDTAIGLSGGFDGRLMLSFFYKTNGKSLETFTYNRAGKLDLWIASHLSKKFNVIHKKFVLNPKSINIKPRIEAFKESEGDAFTQSFTNLSKDFFRTENSFKVSLGGNGADTDWEFGEKQLNKLEVNEFKNFIKSYSLLLVSHPLVSTEITAKLALRLESYFLEKYSVFEDKDNYLQLLGSAFFHLERFRGEQGFIYSQITNRTKDIFAPFATESFNQAIFSAPTKEQLQRTLKEGIHYRLYYSLTEGKVLYAPILTAQNEFGTNIIQKTLNFIAPYLPKIIWKAKGGDTNTQIRKKFSSSLTIISKEYILSQDNNKLWEILDYTSVKNDIEKNNYSNQYHQLATMLKFVENNTK